MPEVDRNLFKLRRGHRSPALRQALGALRDPLAWHQVHAATILYEKTVVSASRDPSA